MIPSRAIQRAALTTVVLSASALTVSASAATAPTSTATAPTSTVTAPVSAMTVPALAQAAEMPPACQSAMLDTLEKFPVVDYTVPDKVQNTALVEFLNLSDTDQAVFTAAACTAWNNWATANGKAIADDLDTRYRAAAAPVCNKFARSTLATIKKYAPNIPAETRELEKVAKKVWASSMQKLETQATNADCKTTYGAVKAGW
ncbi:hypothetical protein ACP4I1_36015 [Streptomyces sp. WG4]|uniref:hypothetical protein n=1 Tax=Streptomyces sp. WG4 TaxID=3417649 RepID=UPI003CEF63AF